MTHRETKVQLGKPSIEQLAETIDELIRLIGVVKIDFDWMLADIKKRTDELYGGGNYSKELKSAIVTKELIDSV